MREPLMSTAEMSSISESPIGEDARVIYTIGHSTRSFEEFVSLLEAHGVTRLADIRTVPRSRRHPQFSRDALAAALPEAGIEYRHFPMLGGLRKPRPDSVNLGWRHAGFRGYADHMQTLSFHRGLAELIDFASGAARAAGNDVAVPPRAVIAPAARASAHARVRASGGGPPRAVIMCAEALWWRCHRQLVADALVARGFGVRHIISAGPAAAHELTAFARVIDGEVSYPGLI